MSSRYSMEFNMDSGPRGRSIVASSDNKALSTKGVPSSHTSLPRDASQRFAREITELEYKLLEEKTRAHECEKQLKEEIMLERGRIPHMVNEKVNQIMKDREKEMREEILSSLSASRGDGGHTEVNALRQELERVRQQVKKYQQMQMDTEKRHQDERIEALDTRTGQLRGDTAKKAQEGDIIGRAMQVMCEYEDIVHSSEESTLARLAHHMECFEKEWIRRTREFESQKGDFEARVMEKALSALQSHSEDIGAIGKRITEKTINLLKNQGETRMKLEEEVLEHSEAFKKQYKDILEHEFRERCRAYDEKFADRERSLLHIIQSEREKIIAAERKAVEKHEDAYMGAMAEAMREISELRKQLLQEHQETQSRGIQKLLARRDEMAKEQENIISEANSRVEKIEKQCFEAVDTAQKALVEMQAKIAARESDMAEKLLTVDVEREKVRVAELTKVRVEVDKQWKEIVDELSQRHSDELANQLKELQTRIDFIHSQQFEREQELRQNYETKLVRMEEAADERWSRRLQETSKSLDRHLEVIQVLRDDNERLLSQVASLQEQFELREKEISSKVATVQMEHEQVWHQKMDEMRIRYDRLLDEALGGPSGDAVSRAEHNNTLEMLKRAEERLVDMRNSERERIGAELNQLNDMWRGRLDEERADRIVWEQDQLKKLAELRVEIQADSRKREIEALRRMEQEKLEMHEMRSKTFLGEMRDSEALEEQIRAEFDAKARALEEEFQEAFSTKCIMLEERIKEKENSIEKKRQEMRKEMRDFEEKTMTKASERLECEKEEMMRDVRSLHEKIIEEKRKLQEKNMIFEKDTQQRYADMFEECRDKLREHIFEMSASHMEHWRQCEDSWLTFRGQELEMIFKMKAENEAKIIESGQEARATATASANKLLETERELMMKMEIQLRKELEDVRIEAETTSRERAMKLIDERNAIQAESEKERVKQEADIWEKIESRILQQEHESQAQRRAMELEIRDKYDALVAAEKKRADKLMEANIDDQRMINNNVEKMLREKDEQWHKKRLEQEAADSVNREQQYIKLAKHADERVEMERQRQEKILRNKEENFEKERARMLDAVEKQYKENEAAILEKTTKMREDYETNIRQLTMELNRHREQFITDIANQQSKQLLEKDHFEAESIKKFEKALDELRSLLEKREREHHAHEIELHASIETSKREYEEKVRKQYEEFVANHQASLQKLHSDYEDKALKHEKEHQKSLVNLRKVMEDNLSKLMEETEKKSESLTEGTREHFHAKLHDQIQLLKEERDKRLEAESHIQELVMEIDVLKSGIEQQKLDIYQTIHEKFEKRFSELHEKTRAEKESLAKALLEEEEKRATRELARKSIDYRYKGSSYDDKDEEYITSKRGTNGMNTSTISLSGALRTSTHANASNTMLPASGNTTRRRQQHTPSSPRAPNTLNTEISLTSSTADISAAEQINNKKERLRQLWMLMDTPDEESKKALIRCSSCVSSSDTLAALSDEVRRLEAMLPILELITRKEFIQHRVVEMSRQQGKEVQIADFVEELDKLASQLVADIRRFEEKHRVPFIYRGENYLNIILREVQMQQDEGIVTQLTKDNPQPAQRR